MKILILKFSSIGDIILSTSPLASLRKCFPEARIDFFTMNDYSSILEGHPYINEILILERAAGFVQIKRAGKHLNTMDYDLVVDLHNTLRSKIIRKQMKNSEIRILKKPRWKRFQLFQFHINRFSDTFSQLSLLHEPLIDLLDTETSIPKTSLFLSESEKQIALDQLKEMKILGDYGVIIPGAAWKQKIWNCQGYTEVIKELESINLHVVLIGSSSDIICNELSEINPQVVDLHGKTNLRETLAFISQAKLVIGSDTGFVHGAEALGVPVVMIMGPTSVETGGGPNLSESIIVESDDLWCRPCSQNGRKPCYRGEQVCMNSINPRTVKTAVQKVLEV